jgi:hypothetical protein
MGTSVTFNTGAGVEITQDQLDQIAADVLAQIGTSGIPEFPQDPTDFTGISMWKNTTTGEIKCYVSGGVMTLDTKADSQDVFGNTLNNV